MQWAKVTQPCTVAALQWQTQMLHLQKIMDVQLCLLQYTSSLRTQLQIVTKNLILCKSIVCNAHDLWATIQTIITTLTHKESSASRWHYQAWKVTSEDEVVQISTAMAWWHENHLAFKSEPKMSNTNFFSDFISIIFLTKIMMMMKETMMPVTKWWLCYMQH